MNRRAFLCSAASVAALRGPLAGAVAAPRKIDFHVHLGRNRGEMEQVTPANAAEAARRLLEEMDRHQVEKSLIVAVEPLFPTEVYLEAAKVDSRRLLVACSVVPRPVHRAVEKLKEHHRRGAKALKLQPMQYDPRDAAVERLIYEAVKLGMPVLFHHTDLPKTFPEMLNHVASTFHDGRFVVIHFGGVFGFQDVLPLARLPNVWLETSTAFPRIVRSPARQQLHFLREENRLNKLIFGSELASAYSTVSGAIDELLGPDAPEEVVRAVYRGNAERLLKLTISSRVESEESDREKDEKVREVLEALGARAGSRVADVGAGAGFYSVRLAAVVGAGGKVLAVDSVEDQVQRLRQRVEEDRLGNVEVIHGADDNPKLPAGSLDGVLIVDAYHEFVKHEEMLGHLRAALRPGGRLVAMDRYRLSQRAEPREKQVRAHRMAPELVEAELRKAGFEVTERRDPFLERPDDTEPTRMWLLVARRPQ